MVPVMLRATKKLSNVRSKWWSLLQEGYLWLAVIFAAYLRIRSLD